MYCISNQRRINICLIIRVSILTGHGLHSKWNKLINAGNYNDNEDGKT